MIFRMGFHRVSMLAMQHMMPCARSLKNMTSLSGNLSVMSVNRHESSTDCVRILHARYSLTEHLVPRRHTEAICLLTRIMLTLVDDDSHHDRFWQTGAVLFMTLLTARPERGARARDDVEGGRQQHGHHCEPHSNFWRTSSLQFTVGFVTNLILI